MASYPQPAPEQPGYLNPPEGQFGTVPPPVGTYAPPTQPTYPTGTQPYPQQAPPYNLGNTYDPNTAPMAGGGAYTNQGFQAPPSYDTVTSGKQ
ncbi:proline-rich protein 2-like [Ylistrum balloti]|uniref:proline-rich protein 2-like n=1 Tax=Ylistrum balloti TaxID=509963 RepID=UPI002905EAFE|nr:proline-rich protein 2-like [Ylistrum balloti]